MISQQAEQQMDHSATFSASLAPHAVFISRLQGCDLIFLRLTSCPAFTPLPSSTPTHSSVLILLLENPSLRFFRPAVLSRLPTVPSSCPWLPLLYLLLRAPPPALSPTPSLHPAPSVSYYSGQVTWRVVLWGFPAGVTVVRVLV